MPDSVEMPAPVSATTLRAWVSQAATSATAIGSSMASRW
jgi:hypothetical protein